MATNEIEQLELALIEHARQLAYARGSKQHWIGSLKSFASQHLNAQLRECVGKPDAVLCIDDDHFSSMNIGATNLVAELAGVEEEEPLRA